MWRWGQEKVIPFKQGEGDVFSSRGNICSFFRKEKHPGKKTATGSPISALNTECGKPARFTPLDLASESNWSLPITGYCVSSIGADHCGPEGGCWKLTSLILDLVTDILGLALGITSSILDFAAGLLCLTLGIASSVLNLASSLLGLTCTMPAFETNLAKGLDARNSDV